MIAPSAFGQRIEPAPDESTTLYLEVRLNHTPHAKLVPFVLREEGLHAHASELRPLGFALPGVDGSRLIALADLPGLVTRFDHQMQRIELDAPLALLSLKTTRLDTSTVLAPPVSPTVPGMLLNYDFYAATGSDGMQWSGIYESRFFGVGTGVLGNTMITRVFSPAQRLSGSGWRKESLRLDTSWHHSWPERMLTLELGDSVTGGLDWSRPVRMGGVRIGSNFALQPYRMTVPLPTFFGEVAVPSTVDLYVNGLKQYTGNVPMGPFQLDSNPGVTGMGMAQIVVTDSFGRSTVLALPFYSTQRLLAEGLTHWSASLGRVRMQYGRESFSYDDSLMGNATFRRGLSNRFTIEAHAEMNSAVRNGGVGALWLLGTAGVLSASSAYGTADKRGGTQYSVGYQWNRANMFVDVHTQRTQRAYRDIASVFGEPPARVTERAMLGINTAPLGSLGFNYVRHADPGHDSRYAGISWSRQLGNRVSASASLVRSLTGVKETNAFISLSYSLGEHISAGTSMQRRAHHTSTTLHVAHPSSGDGGFGWRTQLRDDNGNASGQAELAWLGRHGRASLGAASFGNSSHGYANVSGSLVALGDSLFAARDIGDGFALVSTGGIADVPVKLENRVVGNSDDRGLLLVTRLNARQHNKISIDPMNLPANMQIADVSLNATPSERAGTLLRFKIRTVRAAVVVLHDANGHALPMGSRVHGVNGNDIDAVVGHDGETYLDTLDDTHHDLRVHAAEGPPCQVRVTLPPDAGGIPRIGPLRCQAQASP